MARSSATIIVHPRFVAKLRMIELARWAWAMDRNATLRDTRSGNSLVILEPITDRSRSGFLKQFGWRK